MKAAVRREILKMVERQWKPSRIPGLALAVTDRQRIIFEAGFGSQDLLKTRKFSASTSIPIGSIGKSMVSLCLLRLRSRRKLNLDAPAGRYLPWLKVRSKYPPFTVRDLMDHLAGIMAGPEMAPAGALSNGLLLNHVKPQCAPRKSFHYSNVGYKLLGYIIERIAQKSLAQVCQEEILGPLGMKRSFGSVHPDIRDQVAEGFIEKWQDRPTPVDRPVVQAPWLDYPGGDGCVASSAADLCRYLRYFLNQDRHDPSTELHQVFDTDNCAKLGDQYFYSHGWFLRNTEKRPLMGHGGYHVGYSSNARMDHASGLGVAITYNGPWNWINASELAATLLDFLREGKKLKPPQPSFGGKVDDAHRFAGTYRSAHRKLKLSALVGRLNLSYDGKRLLLEKRGADIFYASHPDFRFFHLQFVPGGKKCKECYYGGEHFVRQGLPLGKPSLPKAWQPFLGHYRSHDPWGPAFRVVARKARLVQVNPDGSAFPLVPKAGRSFLVGDGKYVAETLAFDTLIENSAQRAILSGAPYYKISSNLD